MASFELGLAARPATLFDRPIVHGLSKDDHLFNINNRVKRSRESRHVSRLIDLRAKPYEAVDTVGFESFFCSTSTPMAGEEQHPFAITCRS